MYQTLNASHDYCGGKQTAVAFIFFNNFNLYAVNLSSLAVPSSLTQFCLGHTSEKPTYAFYQFSKCFTGHRLYWKVTSEAHNESALSCFLPPLSHSQGRVDFKSKAGSGDGASPPILPNICENIAYWFVCVCFSLRLSFLCVSVAVHECKNNV